MTILILLVAGFLSGVTNAIAGGGALITFPAMLYAGLSPLTATITSSLVVGPGLMTAVLTNRKDIAKIPTRYLVLLLPWVFGGVIGMLILNFTSHDTFNVIVPWLLTITVLLFISQPYMHKHIHRPAHLRPQFSVIAIWASVFAVSIYAGYFGIGVGLMLLTIFGFSKIKSIHQIIALKNISACVLAFIVAIFFATQGKIAWEQGIVLAIGSITGGYVGARFTRNVSQSLVRILVGLIGSILIGFAFIKF